MRYRFFTIPVHDAEEASAELNRCLAEERVLAVDRQFVADGSNSAWALYVAVQGAGGRPTAMSKRSKVDYREVLNESDFALFARLRKLRKELAERDGVPLYAVFTNEQLAAIVQARVTSATALKAIDGVGDSRVEKYGPPLLAIINSVMNAESAVAGRGGNEQAVAAVEA